MSEQDLPALRGFVESAEVVEPAEKSGKVGVYDLSRTSPEERAGIARMSVAGVPLVDICRVWACSPHKVYAVRRDASLIARAKEDVAKLGSKFAFAAEACLDSFLVDLVNGKVAPREKSFAAKFFMDAAMPAMGQATAIVEHKRGPSAEEVRSLAEMLRERAAKVVEVSAEVRAPDYGAGAEANKDGVSGVDAVVCAGVCAGDAAQDGGQGVAPTSGEVAGGGGGSSFQKSAGERMHSNEAGRRDNAREDVEP